MKWKTIAYKKKSGKSPMVDYLLSLDAKQRSKVARAVLLLEEFGLGWGEPDVKHLEDGIYELRIRLSNNQFRVLMFHFVKNKIVLTHGFTKKEQKTSKKEIEKAKKYRVDFLNRIEKGEIQI
jgi:phage-related protein